MMIIVSGLDLLLKRDALNAGAELVWEDLDKGTCEIIFPKSSSFFIDNRTNIVNIISSNPNKGMLFNLAYCEYVKLV